MTKRHATRSQWLVAAFAAALGLNADVVTNDYLKIETPTSWSGVTNIVIARDPGHILSDFTLTGRSFVRLRGLDNASGTASYYIATNGTDVAIDIHGGSALYASYRNSEGPTAWVATGIDTGKDARHSRIHTHVGIPFGAYGTTGKFKMTLSDAGTFGSLMNSATAAFPFLHIESSVPTNAPGTIDYLQLNANATADMSQIIVSNAYPARVLFNGGTLFWSHALGDAVGKIFTLSPCAGSELILEGINGKNVNFKKIVRAGTFTGRLGGTVRFRGGDVVLIADDSTQYWQLVRNDNVKWEQSGDLVLQNGVWLKVGNGYILFYGAGQGIVRVSSSASTKDRRAIFDLSGFDQPLNGVVADGTGAAYSMLTNSGSEVKSVILGNGDVDTKFGIACSDRVKLIKNGRGRLDFVGNTQLKKCEVSAACPISFSGTNVFTDFTYKGDTLAEFFGTVWVNGVMDFSAVTSETPELLGTSIHLGSAASIKLKPSATLTVLSLFVDGTACPRGTYTSSESWIDSGSVTFLSSGGEAAVDFTWTGGASPDNSVLLPGNWGGNAPPLTTQTSTRATFASGGSSALWDAGRGYLSGLVFGSGGNFSIEPADAATDRMLLYGGISVQGSDADVRRYEVSVPVAFAHDTEKRWIVPTNKTLVISGGASSLGPCEIRQIGTGTVEVTDFRVCGTYHHRNGGGLLKIKGDFGVPGDLGTFDYRIGSSYENDTVWREDGNLLLDGATIFKPVAVGSRGMLAIASNTQTWLRQVPGTTNVFEEIVDCGAISTSFHGDNDATLVFKKGIIAKLGLRLDMNKATHGNGRGTIILDGPVKMTSTEKGANYSEFAGLTIVFRSTGNVFAAGYSGANVTTEFAVDNVFDTSATPQFLLNDRNRVSVADLRGTTQRICKIRCDTGDSSGKSSLKGVYPSALVINPGPSASEANTYVYSLPTTGWVAFRKAGDGLQKMHPRNYASYGDVEVSGGTLEFLSGATWRNGTNVTVRGTGVLKIDGNDVFNRDFAELSVQDDGVLEIASGVDAAFAKASVDGIRISSGYYSRTDPGPLAGHFSNNSEGRVRIGNPGLKLIFR